jgi:hypothetical protein
LFKVRPMMQRDELPVKNTRGASVETAAALPCSEYSSIY